MYSDAPSLGLARVCRVELKVSRHRLHFGIAIVPQGGVTSAAQRRGQSLAAIRKEVMLPCVSVAEDRRFSLFGSMRAGHGEIVGMWETTSAAKIRNQRISLPSANLISSETDGVHGPTRPMAAHQLDSMQRDGRSVRCNLPAIFG
jgi:hypothetical protein